jgi:ribonuclease HI
MAAETKGKPLHAVLYTDGGCRSNDKAIAASRGVGGWGIHGYLYYDEPAKVGSGCKSARPTNKGYIAGESGKTDITLVSYVDGFGALLPDSTNNIAELVAAIRALEVCVQQGVNKLLFVMDSEYVLHGITKGWAVAWEAANWRKPDGSFRANADYWKTLLGLLRALQADNCVIEYQWVKGHDPKRRYLGNELADAHATRAVIAGFNGHAEETLKVSDAKGYWNTKSDRSRLFSHPNWYFATQGGADSRTADGRYIYYLGDPREDGDLFGKKIPNATFSILYLKDPEPVLEVVRGAVEKLGMHQYQGLIFGHLDKIFLPATYTELLEYGHSLLILDRKKQRLQLSDKTVIAEEKSPARLSYNAIEALQSLEVILQEYLSASDGSRVRHTDLTDLLYESEAGKKKPTMKLKADITSTLRSMEVSANHASDDRGTDVTKLILTLGQDTPDRNTLAALADTGVKVTLLTWPESTHAIRFATVIESDGNVGIWSGIYANLHMLVR